MPLTSSLSLLLPPAGQDHHVPVSRSARRSRGPLWNRVVWRDARAAVARNPVPSRKG